jgi:hypothetical protein
MKLFSFAWVVAFVIASALATAATAQEVIQVYVDATGSDANAGSAEKPVASIAKAIEIALQRNTAAKIQLAAGRYQLDAPIALDKVSNLTIAGDAGAPTMISGGRQITGWKRVGDVFQTIVPDVRDGQWRFQELFVGGERRTRARAPNDGFFRVAEVGPDKRTTFKFKDGDLKNWSGTDQMYFVFLHDWSVSRVRFANIDEASHVGMLADRVGPVHPFFAMDHFESQPRYFVENSPSLLDAPGEWYLDESSGILTYKPFENEQPESLEAFAPAIDALVVVRGDAEAGRYCEFVTLENLVLEHCLWLPPAHGFAEGQATRHERRRGESSESELIPAAVTFDVARNCLVRNCTFRHLGGTGVWLRRECVNNRIERCTFDDIAGNGLNIGETFTRQREDGNGNIISLVSRGNRVTDSRVSQCGKFAYGAVGIWVGITAETTIAHNEVSELPYTGISIGWQWDPRPTGAEKNVLEHNHIHHVLQLMSDGGGIYTLGRQPGSVLRRNHVHDVPVNAGRAESNGFFMDEGSSEFLVEENVIQDTVRSPIRFHQALGNTLQNNYLAHAENVPMFRYNSTDPGSMTYEDNRRLSAASDEKSKSSAEADRIIDSAGPR